MPHLSGKYENRMERYGRVRDPRCANCMAHCGPTSRPIDRFTAVILHFANVTYGS